MKKPYIIFFVLVFILSGCTPKSRIYNSAINILEKVEKICVDISDDVEKLNDEYTIGVFETIKESIAEQRAILSDNPSKDEMETSLTSLSRLEKDLGSIKVLTSGMDKYLHELTFEFTNDTESSVEKIVLESTSGIQAQGSMDNIASGSKAIISYPVDDGTWSITSYMENGVKVTCSGIKLSSIKNLKLIDADGRYEYAVEYIH